MANVQVYSAKQQKCCSPYFGGMWGKVKIEVMKFPAALQEPPSIQD